MKLKYIKTMDFDFENVEVINCKNIEEMNNKIKESEVIQLYNCGDIEYINSNYIMYFGE